MSDLDDFLAEMLPRRLAEVEALHNGDPGPELAMWSTQNPVTLYGAAGINKSGWDEVNRTFHWLASRFSNCTMQSFELVAAGISGDLAYTVGFEHTAHSIAGDPVEPYTLRVTHIYRREHGKWKMVHRHGDHPPTEVWLEERLGEAPDQSPPAEAATE